VESRLLSEFLAVRFPGLRTLQRARVGRIPAELDDQTDSPAVRAMTGVWRRWVDAIVIGNHKITIIEAGIVPDPGDVSRLEMYLDLFPRTPEFQPYALWQRTGLLVHAVADPVVEALAARRGILVHVFTPPWVRDYLTSLYPRKSRAPLAPG
jgi:hypothetical protein